MNILDVNKLKNKDYIVLLPKCDYDIRKSVEYSFENVFYLDYELTKEHADVLIDFMNTKSNQIILFDYDNFYRLILPHIRKSKKIKWIIKSSLAQLTNGCVRATFTNLMEFCDRNIVNAIGFNLGELSTEYKIGDKIDVVGNLEINSFNGVDNIQINMKDIMKSI